MKMSEGEMCHFSICPHCIPQSEGTATPTDLLIVYNDSRLTLFKTEDIQMKLMDDHLSVDPRSATTITIGGY
jgi:hypothetical protein